MIVINEKVELKQLEEKLARKILGCGGTLMMVEVRFKAGGVGLAHSHEEYEQVSYIAQGSFKVQVDGEEAVLHQGDSFYAGKNVEHGVVALENAVILDVFTPIRKDFLE